MKQLILLLLTLIALLPTGLLALAQNAPETPPQGVAWDGRSRFTMLVMGMDRRPGARDTLNVRTDTIMLVSVDPGSGRMGILSIPRDMHFAMPGGGELVPVNTLLVRGEALQENYGPYFAMDTLQMNLGMYIDAYIAIDFEAFIMFIDAIGGVTVDVPYNISDPLYPDMNYGYDPFYLSAGVHTLDGRTALKFARTRHMDNDYLRGQRQLQIVQAVRDRLRDPLVLQALIVQSPLLFSSLARNFYSNLTPQQIVFLGLAGLNLRDDGVSYGALNEAYSFPYATGRGTVRVPDRTLMPELLAEVFGENYGG